MKNKKFLFPFFFLVFLVLIFSSNTVFADSSSDVNYDNCMWDSDIRSSMRHFFIYKVADKYCDDNKRVGEDSCRCTKQYDSEPEPDHLVGVTIPNPLKHDNLESLIDAIVVFIRNVALMIAPIIFIIAGLMYYFAGGDPEKAKTATNLIKWAIVGLAIIIVASGITAVITSIMGVDMDPLSSLLLN